MKTVHRLSFVICLGLSGACVTALEAQDTLTAPPPQRADTTGLVFEREIFTYPQYERRNPFMPLVAGEEYGPRFEEIELKGIIHDVNPDRSVAMFATRLGREERPEETGQAVTSYRVRRGETLGNVRILEIHERRVVVLVEDFGMTEQRVLELPRPGQGGL